ncbi:DUF1906 domain-containing protein [Paenibacillus sp. GCM10027628]|uniref:DUF1906 domain-containing protein n=1 Tax=Paenibacillus sp. GCM10027628 TaxID=3273413 RepID=UPI00363D9310
MAKGVDTPTNCTSLAAAIKESGYDFVCRYYNRNNPGKNLTRAEANALTQAGLYIVAVWENGFPTSAGYFSYTSGNRDGKDAFVYARDTIGQPFGTPIYFAVDYDAALADIQGGIREYIRGVIDSFKSLSEDDYSYEVGVYGSGLTCQSLMQAFPEVTYAWLSESIGWSGYHSFDTWNIKQLSGSAIAGTPVDTNVTTGNGGGFQVGKAG